MPTPEEIRAEIRQLDGQISELEEVERLLRGRAQTVPELADDMRSSLVPTAFEGPYAEEASTGLDAAVAMLVGAGPILSDGADEARRRRDALADQRTVLQAQLPP